jgi:uncharacterized membrane protein YkoI
MTLTRKLALLLAAGLTAFTLVAAGALISYNAAQPQAAAAQSQTQTQSQVQQPAAATAPDASASAQQTDSGAQNPGEQAQAQTATGNVPAAAPTYPISAEQAASLALQAAPNSFLQTTPMLVNFDGTVAYEVGLDQGQVYINATTGEVLYNSASLTASNSALGAQGSSGNAGEREDHERYEEHEDGDD